MRTKIKTKSIALCLIISFMLFNSIVLVSALGVSPVSKTVDFEPNTDVELTFNIINSQRNNVNAILTVFGELSDMIFLEEKTVAVKASDDRKPFRVILRFPSEMEPGIHKGGVEITPEIPETEKNMFLAYVAQSLTLSVRVPYPSKYTIITLTVLDVDEGIPLPVYVEFDNLGSEDILKAGAQVELYNPDDVLIDTLTAPEISLEKNTLGKTQAKSDTKPELYLTRGFYKAVVNAYYDDVEKRIDTNFTLGIPKVRIRELVTRTLGVDQVNKIMFLAYNDWNTELSVQGNVTMAGRHEAMPIFELEADQEKEITAFFDTTGLEPGQYNMSITLKYGKYTRTETFGVEIVKDLKLIERAPGIPLVAYILIIVLIIIIVIVAIILVKRRKTSGERKL